MLLKLIELCSTDPKIWHAFGDVRSKLGDVKGADFAYGRERDLVEDTKGWVNAEANRISQLDPKLGARNPQAWADLAVECFNAGHFTRAHAAFLRLLSLTPDDTLWRFYGRTCYQLKFLDTAALAFEKALEMEPANAALWRELGIIRMDLQEFPVAISALKKALELDPKDTDAAECLTMAETELKRQGQETIEGKDKASKSLIFKEAAGEVPSLEKLGEHLINTRQIHNVTAIENARFPVNFKDVIPGSRQDLVFSYRENVPVRYAEDPRRPGYTMPVEFVAKIRKMDVIAFLMTTKTGTTELRVYQIGRRHE